jgi:hypothetical protein
MYKYQYTNNCNQELPDKELPMDKKSKAMQIFEKETHTGWWTTECIFKAVPQSLYSGRTTAREIVDIAIALNAQYQSGRSSAKAEVIDDCPTDGAVWVGPINKSIEWKKEGENLITKIA